MLFPSQIKNLLRQYQISPKKFMGQNFLISQKVVHQMLAAADIKKTDIILEIGPGLGALTEALVKTGAKIIAVEKDKDLVCVLKDKFQDVSNLTIIQDDIRQWSGMSLRGAPHLRASEGRRGNPRITPCYGQAVATSQTPCQRSGTRNDNRHYKIIANLPYYLTAPIIRQFLEAKNPPASMVLLVQKEVAQRICARAPKMNLLAISVQVYAKPRIVAYVNQKSFWPRPKVDGAIIKIEPPPTRPSPFFKKEGKIIFFKIIKAGFAHPRKQLAGNLSQTLKIKKEKAQEILKQLGLNPLARAENLDIKEWLKLVYDLSLD